MEVFITALLTFVIDTWAANQPRIFWPLVVVTFLLFIASIPTTYNKVSNTANINNYINDEFSDGKNTHGFTVAKQFKQVGGRSIEEVKFY